jgi:hypothetical protein
LRSSVKARGFDIRHVFQEKNMAERLGFEPRVPVSQDNSLAVSCFRPLSHLSNLNFIS